MQVEFEVIQEDIDTSLQCKSKDCAIAKVVTKKLKGHFFSAGVTTGVIRKYTDIVNYEEGYNPNSLIIELPRQVQQFIMLFDQNKEWVNPIKFSLDIPKEYLC